jgi:cell pole-organizing protein PopZ
MNQPAKAQEPSMEEILASIRRIIADDDTAKPAKPEPPKPAAAAPAPAPPPSPPKAGPAAEPAAMSQDDIDAMLAGFDQPPPAAPAPPPPEPEADILDLTEAMAAPEPALAPVPEPTFRTIGTESDVMFAEPPEPEPAPPRAIPPPSPPVQAVAQPAEPPMLSAPASAAVDAAFNSLAQTVLVHNARTLEDLVKEMMRPMLKSWLDDNLPNLVERLVRAEIERVSRGRG